MTRINLVPPEELMDQHLFAEFREIKMVPMSLRRSLAARGLDSVVKRIPPAFTLNTGHVSFFYDKGLYLANRFLDLRNELERRGVNYNRESQFDPLGVYGPFPELFNDYTPTPEALALIRERIATRISQRPGWYRFYGKVHQ